MEANQGDANGGPVVIHFCLLLHLTFLETLVTSPSLPEAATPGASGAAVQDEQTSTCNQFIREVINKFGNKPANEVSTFAPRFGCAQ